MPANQPTSVRTFKWGIFDVAYEVPQRPSFSPLTSFWKLHTPAAYGRRFLQDVYVMAPGTFVAYLVCSIWLSISPGLLLYYSHSVLQRIEASTPCGNVNVRTTELEVSIYLWLLGVFISVVMERLRDEKELLLCAHLRAHFLPLMTKASLNADVRFLHDKRLRRRFPMPCSFGEGGPGWDLLKALVNWTQSVVSFLFEVSVLLIVINQKSLEDRYILGLQAALTFGVLFLAPSNGAHGAGYTFWTTNARYNRLNSLYSMVFDDKLRETIAKDGLNDFLEKEYRATSKALGIVKSDALTLACLLPPPWYWALAQTVLLDHPMALCALFLAWGSPSCIITNMVFFRSVTNTLRYTFESFNSSFRSKSLHSLLSQAQGLYEPLDQANEVLQRGTVPYPRPSSSIRGMKITLKGVDFQYQNTVKDTNALNGISLNVEPGSLVVVVGANGSGKTTLLKLLARLQEPTAGDILVDDIPIAEYALTNFRKHVTFLMQSEEIYPLSLRENLLMAVSDHSLDEELIRPKMDEAVSLGGSDRLIERLGYEAVLSPPSLLAQSLQGCGNGTVGPAAMREAEKHTGRQRGFSISIGEKQRFIASRSFMRLLNSDTKLLIVDEPTSALDAVAEKNLFRRFQEHREGKTIIFVTHRFGGLVKQADLIVCMKEGTVVEQGSHEQLMSSDGEYARLYNAQL